MLLKNSEIFKNKVSFIIMEKNKKLSNYTFFPIIMTTFTVVIKPFFTGISSFIKKVFAFRFYTKMKIHFLFD